MQQTVVAPIKKNTAINTEVPGQSSKQSLVFIWRARCFLTLPPFSRGFVNNHTAAVQYYLAGINSQGVTMLKTQINPSKPGVGKAEPWRAGV